MRSDVNPSDSHTGQTVLLSGSFVDAIGHGRQPGERLLLLIYHSDGAERVVLSPGTPVVLGRALPSQVRIRDSSLSREHARFTLSDGLLTVEDLQSTNGTWVRGERVSFAEVRHGDELFLGSVMISVRALTPEQTAPAAVLLSHERFRVALEDEVARARYFGRSFAVLLVRSAPGAGMRASRLFLSVSPLLRPVDRVALYSPDTLALLLTEVPTEAALDLARAITAPLANGEPAALVGVAGFPGRATAAEELLDLCWSAARSATPDDPVRSTPSGAWTCCGDAEPRCADDEPIAVSPGMRNLFRTVDKLARSPIPVLLLGETGTGKEVVAQAIHQRGPRRARPMVCVNCGSIPQQLIESTLFGHERGAFTGASQQQRGVFEAADGGTVFLDEIGELPAAAQAALLRTLETRRVTRVGSNREIEVDVRIVAATHRDLEAMCLSGDFRLDLLYRLNAMTLTIPPLRARPEEIAPLALRFLRQANEANCTSIQGIDPEALALLQVYAWRGNVRELRNAIERAVAISEGDWITEKDLPERVCGAHQAHATSMCEPAEPSAETEGGEGSLKARLQRYEAELITRALRDAAWNQTEAARALDLPLRTLVHKLKALGIKKLGYAPT
jgi:DNA-binding NtrC family response regulator